MALIKNVVVDRIEVLENGCIQVREKTEIIEDGNVLSSSYHRHVLAPGDDYSSEPSRVREIAAAVHTQPVIDLYLANLEQ